MKYILILLIFSFECKSSNFNKFFPHLIKSEGILFTVTQYDRGGATKFGITYNTYRRYCYQKIQICDKNNDNILSAIDLSMTTIRDVQPIYYELYWSKMQGDLIENQAIAEIIVDMNINCGSGQYNRHIKAVQKFVGVKQDGIMGKNTAKAINATNSKILYEKIYQYRSRYYKAIGVGKQSKFLRGWLNRLNNSKKIHQNEKYI